MTPDACCETMAGQVAYECPDHPDVTECPDKLVDRRPSGDFILLVHDGGTGGPAISLCPWCGEGLGNAS